MALEKGIAEQVKAFIAAGRPSMRDQSIDDRRAGYLASAVLAGETETRVNVKDIDLEGMTFRLFSPLDGEHMLPTLIYYHGGCFVSGEFATTTNNYANSPFTAAAGSLQSSTVSHPSINSRPHMMTPKKGQTLSGTIPPSWALTAKKSLWRVTAQEGIWPLLRHFA